MNKNKKWCILFFSEFLILIFLVVSVTVIIDPFFHYHKPLPFLGYSISKQRYQNDGIVRNFEYDAIITGSSVTENFKASEMNKLFDVNSVKVPFSSGSMKEVNQNLERAVESNNNIRYIVRGIDFDLILKDKDYMAYDESKYPTYLYDDNFINDVRYLLNKDVVFFRNLEVLGRTLKGKKTDNFDQAFYLEGYHEYGKNAVDKIYSRKEKKGVNESLSEKEINSVKENIKQNLFQLANDNPNIEFYYFYTPYSIYYWDYINNNGTLLKQIEAEKIATEMLLELGNVHLFSFWDELSIVEDLNNYRDTTHYRGEVNSQILNWMAAGEKNLTKENYNDYYETILSIYENYDYEALFS